MALAVETNKVFLYIKLKTRRERELNRKSFEIAISPIFVAQLDIQHSYASDYGDKKVTINLAKQ